MGSFRDLETKGQTPGKQWVTVDRRPGMEVQVERDVAPEAPRGGTFRRMDKDAQTRRKPTFGQEASGALSTLYRSIPGADEVNDAAYAWVKTAADFATGKARIEPGEDSVNNKAYRANLTEARRRSKAAADDFATRHPTAKALTDGIGMTLTAIPALMTGGASAAPQAAPVVAKGLLGALKNLGVASAKGGVVGALSGNLTGVLDEGTLEERLQAGNNATGPSALIGAALPPVLTGMGAAANAVGRRLQPAEQQAAAQAGRVLSARAPQVHDMAPEDNLSLPFERMGPGGETVARAVASVPGPGQDIARTALAERRAGTRGRIMASVTRDLGSDGRSFHDVKEALDKRRLTESRPLYAEAFDTTPPVTDTLERLRARPSIRQAMERGRKIAMEEGENPDGLGLFHMEDPAGYASDAPPSGEVVREASRVAGFARPPRKPTQGKSLVKFIADGGGLRDVGGDVAAMDGGAWHKGRAFQAKLMGPGADADEWALRAWEAGYFPQHQGRPTKNELLDTLAEELRGRPRYAREPDARQADRYRMAEEADEMIYRGGRSDDLPDPDDYVGRPEPQTGPVYGETPTFKAWDYVKRGLDDLIESRRDKLTGKLERSDEVRGWENTRRELRAHLKELNPKYGEALEAYSGPSRQMHALDLGRRMVTGKGDPEEFAQGIDRMSADEVDSLRLGISRGLADVFRSKNPQVAFRQFLENDVLQDRLRTGFGNDEAFARFMGDVMDEFDAQLSYNRILTGSRTTPLAEDIAAVNRAAGDGDLGDRAISVVTDGRPLRQQAFSWAATKLRQAKEAHSGLNNPEVSRLLGQALFRSGDPEELLRAMVAQRIVTQEELDAILPYLAVGEGQVTARATR